ncbi:class I SAM-dependent methyltransferase [Neisseria sp. N95_16]|uniref:Methyltransferase domain-containing protein n=1 Tax=Neisseria brasiliensis TaxID=2666100 RepID=A0A5Q3S480_9NEIS|nr:MULTISPECIES: class I SAM-dependent methyltransferase [Neisseria]MRN38240.1 methyltransferase domain-containing protein [Neisseria brasiliensis]PJO09330.1 class I SAM-dependent methyltransferase [Neisseria sp. N95_16]PJO78114.1 class I SAM-dependent methyltransferase [Neisseria sp. N177_16]QGL25236.1 methyltransferase domain-containing protein [Neisseria brasiliensis]
MSSPWDQRYLGEEYVFGTEPNEFIRRIRPYLPSSGNALDLATGEGRNAVFLAECGLDTEGVDLSAVGLEKAAKLAAERGVNISLRQADLLGLDLPPQSHDVITSVFCHFTEPDRSRFSQRIIAALKPNGLFAGVFYHPNQIANGTGGPSDPAMLGTLEEMQAALDGLEWLIAEHRDHELNEGNRHVGMSSVVYLLGRKAV